MGADQLRGRAPRAQWRRRAPFVLLTACLAAAVTVPVAYVRRNPAVSRASVELVVHPVTRVTAHEVPDAVRVLDREGSLLGTVVGVLDSDTFLRPAAKRAGVRATGLRLSADTRGGGDVIVATIEGRHRTAVRAVAGALVP